jgi:hypothetical protein
MFGVWAAAAGGLGGVGSGISGNADSFTRMQREEGVTAETWQNELVNLTPTLQVYGSQQQYSKIPFYTTENGTVYAAERFTGTAIRGNIYKSTDYGSTWALIGNLIQSGESAGASNVGIGRYGTVLQDGTILVVGIENSQYHVFQSVTFALDAAAAVNSGGGLVSITCTGHTFSAGDFCVFSGTANYDDEVRALHANTTTDTLVITETYAAETFSATDTVTVFYDRKTLSNPIQHNTNIAETDAGYVVIAEYDTSTTADHTIWLSVDSGENWTASLVADYSEWNCNTNDPGHWHYVQWDKYQDCLVAFSDCITPRIYLGVEDTENTEIDWTLLHTDSTGERIANNVYLCLGEDYIGWIPDSGSYIGTLERVSRSDFYAANFGSNIKTMATFDRKWGLAGTQIDDDVFLVGVARHNASASDAPGSYASETYIIYDDCSKIIPGISWINPDSKISGDTAVSNPQFPSIPFEGDLNGKSWVHFGIATTWGTYDRVSVPVSLTYTKGIKDVGSNIIGPLRIAEEQGIYVGPQSDPFTFFAYDASGDTFDLKKSNASATTSLRFFDDGDISIMAGSTQRIQYDATAPYYNLNGVGLYQHQGTFAANDTTPAINGANVFVCPSTNSSSGNAAITDLDGGFPYGQIIYIIGAGGTYPTTIADSGNFNLSAAWTGNADDVLILYIQADNDYIEVGRVDN